MEVLNRDLIRTLIQPQEPPSVSIYLPTHRHHPENQQDPIAYKNLLREVEESLRQKYRGREARPLMEPLHKLADDPLFWRHTLDGLAVLLSGGVCRVFKVQRPVKKIAVVADNLHVKPLIRIVQSADRYQVLCLTRQTAKMYEGNRYALDDLDVNGFPSKLTDALGEELTEPHQTVASYGTGTGGPSPMFHGHGSRKDEVDKDTVRYFRAVDRAVAATFSKPSGFPLILVALTEHQPVFREVTQNPALLPEGVFVNPDSLDDEQLRTAAWKAMEPQYLARLARLSEEFKAAAAHQKGTADLSDAARAAVQGRVASVLIESERVVPGRIDPTTGAITPGNLEDPEVGDMLDDLAEAVLRTGGDVVMVPKERMPSTSGLAATLRF